MSRSRWWEWLDERRDCFGWLFQSHRRAFPCQWVFSMPFFMGSLSEKLPGGAKRNASHVSHARLLILNLPQLQLTTGSSRKASSLLWPTPTLEMRLKRFYLRSMGVKSIWDVVEDNWTSSGTPTIFKEVSLVGNIYQSTFRLDLLVRFQESGGLQRPEVLFMYLVTLDHDDFSWHIGWLFEAWKLDVGWQKELNKTKAFRQRLYLMLMPVQTNKLEVESLFSRTSRIPPYDPRGQSSLEARSSQPPVGLHIRRLLRPWQDSKKLCYYDQFDLSSSCLHFHSLTRVGSSVIIFQAAGFELLDKARKNSPKRSNNLLSVVSFHAVQYKKWLGKREDRK